MSLEAWMERQMQALPVPGGIGALTDAILARHGDAVLAVAFYGSCRRRRDAGDGLADLLVLVDRYRTVHGRTPSALANRILPPNVYYLETTANPGSDATATRYRSKYAIVTLAAFERRCGAGLDAYFWARFAQPVQLAYTRDTSIATRIARARAAAAARFCARAAGLFTGTLSADAFWIRSLQASYRCELRPEAPGAARTLVETDAGYYHELAADLLPALPFVTSAATDRYRFAPPLSRRMPARLEWAVRRIWGKTLNLARLFKAAGTFTDGLDYLLWKIERHSGVRVEVTETMRRRPRRAALGLAWRLWRQGAFK